jgi:hypothetical protein
MPVAKKTDADRLRDAEEIIRRKNAEVVGLKRDLKGAQREADTIEAIRTEIWKLEARPPEPPEWVGGRGGKSSQRGSPMVILSDIHRGEVVDSVQVGGMNKYNTAISKQRIRRFGDTVVDLSFNHMGRAKYEYPGIVCCFGGDMIGGDLHEELLATNDRTSQQSVNELTDELAALLEMFASKFGRVFAPGVVGNHGRTTRKPSFKNRVYTNYDWSIYCNLERLFRKSKYVTVAPSNEADYHFAVFGHRYMLTHGDSLGVAGGDGIIGALGPIMRGAMKVGRSESQIGRDFDTLLICHWHQYISLARLIVNGAVKGYDEYARLKLRAAFERACQALWFSHPEHGITASWPVYLQDAIEAKDMGREWVALRSSPLVVPN